MECSRENQPIKATSRQVSLYFHISTISLLSLLPITCTRTPSICLICSNFRDSTFLLFTGPKLPMRLYKHAMVQLGNGQAIIGGFGDGAFQNKIYFYSCMNRNCSIHKLDQELSVPRTLFVAIPIPDTLSGCITGGKKFHKNYPVSLKFKTYSKPVFSNFSCIILNPNNFFQFEF